MLLKIALTTFFLSCICYADAWEINLVDKEYLLGNGKTFIEVESVGKPKLVKTYKKLGLTIIDYYAGDYGTKKVVSLYKRVVLKKEKVIAHEVYQYKGEGKITQPKWNFDSKTKTLTIEDPEQDKVLVKF